MKKKIRTLILLIQQFIYSSNNRLNYVDLIVIISLFLLGILFHLSLNSKSNYPIGTDSYVYLVQTRSLIENHSLHYKDVSLIYPFYGIIYYFVQYASLKIDQLV